MPLLFCNIGWMEHYKGLCESDQISGGGAYVKEKGRGHETCNFVAYHGKVYGYVQPVRDQIKLERIGALPGEAAVNGVTVVWTATRPTTGGTTIVGWYENATVYRNRQAHTKLPTQHSKDGVDGYWIEAMTKSAHLLLVDARTFEIPRRVKGGMGQSNVWFADSPDAAALVRNVAAYIAAGGLPTSTNTKPKGRAQDQERKARVEAAAIRTCCMHYEKLGYQVDSVEKDNLGWDLEAYAAHSKLRIEVKGLSGSVTAVELTPNEYAAFAENAADYRLVIVNDALSSATLSICRFSAGSGGWLMEGERKQSVVIKERVGASIAASYQLTES